MAVSCPEVMYGAYYPYLYGRAGPSRPFYQYERFNQDLYSSTGVPLAASSSTSAGSHSPCSPLLPPSLSSNVVASAATAQTSTLASSSATSTSNTTIPTIPLGALQRHITKEEDISTARSDTEGTISGAHNDSSCSSGPDSPNNLHHDGSGGPGGSGSGGPGGSGSLGGGAASSDASGGGGGRAQYLSATCVVFTHYSGDSASVVDEHFSRALNFSDKNNKAGSMMAKGGSLGAMQSRNDMRAEQKEPPLNLTQGWV
ncbi:protein vestigial-like [Uranotaenia lowii]|uniref:protein vestigial-like n=1 Tax=Uranotaenia lowii TaxID=190385 RepID=UPI0024793022|nr:protein vestigial-like [Uranotaenia lowii]